MDKATSRIDTRCRRRSCHQAGWGAIAGGMPPASTAVPAGCSLCASGVGVSTSGQDLLDELEKVRAADGLDKPPGGAAALGFIALDLLAFGGQREDGREPQHLA